MNVSLSRLLDDESDFAASDDSFQHSVWSEILPPDALSIADQGNGQPVRSPPSLLGGADISIAADRVVAALHDLF
jgi:hypothetical protein